ncbi:hypothetical protein GRI75_13840 [Altererythrobacter soli]|uniref:Uncharacterized protein n=1 Tax=Croceibacterium soli TaxID=1739690 RepID=A0A6I4UYN5_9SPHN|nr:hypothetical protein [Croceibacterium soli]MXP42723.1 hypothetical protein [Croceibacterium soli]
MPSSSSLKPFLIAKDEEGQVRLTVRETRYNSQGYPWVTARLVEQPFASAAAARAHAAEEYGAKAGEFAAK